MEAEKYLVFSFRYNEEIYIDFYFDEKDTWISFLEELKKLIHFETSSLKLKIFGTDRKDLISNYGNFFSPANEIEISFYYERQYNLDSWKINWKEIQRKRIFLHDIYNYLSDSEAFVFNYKSMKGFIETLKLKYENIRLQKFIEKFLTCAE